MIRLLGAMLLAVSCAGLGLLESLRLKKRIDQLKLLIRIASFLEGEISFAKTTLPEALRSVGGRLASPFSEFLRDLASRLETCPRKILRGTSASVGRRPSGGDGTLPGGSGGFLRSRR